MTQVVLIFEKTWKIVKMIIIDTGWRNMGIYYTVLTKYVYDWNFHNKMFKIFLKNIKWGNSRVKMENFRCNQI